MTAAWIVAGIGCLAAICAAAFAVWIHTRLIRARNGIADLKRSLETYRYKAGKELQP